MRWLPLLLLAGFAPAQEDSRPSILFCIADDWGFGHAGAYGDGVVKTPAFDKVAAEGVLFTHSFCASPSCTPSRAAILTGQAIHRLEDTGNLWSIFPSRLEVYPEILESQGYVIGLQGKGWGPGNVKGTTRTRNPAGPARAFDQFLRELPAGTSFCFWFGSKDPHRPYAPGSGAESGMKPEDVRVPAFLPDTPEIRRDILDYYFEVQRFDQDVARHLKWLEESGRARNTIVVITSDNGMPFPRAKANVYDSGARMPLAIRWPARVKRGRTSDAFVSHCDLALTFLEAAGLRVPESMTGRSLLPLLERGDESGRDRAFIGRERHANVRKGDLSYPVRAIRTREWLLIRNLQPYRWPAGDPEKHVVEESFGDCDRSPSKTQMLARRDQDLAHFVRLAFEKRPAVELYDLAKDPDQVRNVAERNPGVVAKLEAELLAWSVRTADPRAASGKLTGDDNRWDKYPYVDR